MFIQLLANGLVTGSVIALAAAGVSIVYGILRLVNFAYGDYMTFGAFIAVYFNVTLELPIVTAAILAMLATALLSVALELVLWKPVRARNAGFMSLFLVSIGLALVLRHVIYLVAGPQPRTYTVDPYKVYVIGSARLSGAQGIAIVVAGIGILVLGVLIAKTGVGRMMRALADDLPLAAVSGVRTGRRDPRGVDRLRSARRARGSPCRARADLLQPPARVYVAAADLRCGRSRRHRERLRRTGRRARAGPCDGALDLAGARRRRQPDLQAGRRVRRSHCRAPAASAGLVRKGTRRLSTIASFGFWSFVGIVAGIYTLFALGVQVQFGFAGLLNFGQVAFMGIGAYTMAILVVKEDLNMWLAAGCGVVLAMLAALLLGLPTLRLRADYFAITTIAFSEILRYVATNEDRLTGGSQGTINLAGIGKASQYDGAWQSFLGKVERNLHVSGDAAMLILVWTVALLAVAMVSLMMRTPWGRVLKSIREDEDAAASLGKNVFLYKLQALAIGAALGAVAGVFYAWQFSFFSPDDFAPLITFFAWMIVILGGLGRAWTVPVGALVFGVIFAGTRFFDFPPFSLLDSTERAYVRLIVIGLVIIGLMLFRPQGIFGNRKEMVLE